MSTLPHDVPLPPAPALSLINLWSGPRCCSTSLMYSFAQRSDCVVQDEPLYASYLSLTGNDRPYTPLVMEAQSSDGAAVMRQLALGPVPPAPTPTPGGGKEQPPGTNTRTFTFAKHMAKHKVGVPNALLFPGTAESGATGAVQHLLLVREPYALLQSFSKVLAPTQQELGYTALLEIASELRSRGQPVHIILSDQLVRHPEPMLRSICYALGLPFQPAMLSWAPGPKPYDGVWAPWWYQNTHRGTGFSQALQEPREALPLRLRELLGEAQALYRLLQRHALAPLARAAAAAPSAGPAPPGEAGGAAVPSGGGFEAAVQHKDSGTHVYEQDPRNKDILILIRDGVDGSSTLAWRPEARVSVLDSGFMLGDGVWEGLRLHKGVLLFIEAHLSRLYEGAKALDMTIDLSPQQLQALIYSAVDANAMGADSGIHIRLMLTRGLKPTPYQSPYITIGRPTIVIIPEYKAAAEGPKREGLRLFTCHVRRGAADVQDPMWNSHSKLNCIAACIQAKQAGADEALMLDPLGFVSTCNSVNFFCVRRGEVWAPTTKYQLHGITRSTILRLCEENGIPCREGDFTLTEVYSAHEAFVTGTFAGVLPVRCIDGRCIGPPGQGLGPVSRRLQQLYAQDVEKYAAVGRRDLGGRGPLDL